MLPFLQDIWRPVLEITVISILFYQLFRLIQGTRGVQLIKGVVLVLLLFFIVQQLKLDTITWLLTKIVPVAVIAILVIFQPELRWALERLGRKSFFSSTDTEEKLLDIITEAASLLARKRIGALIAIEAEVGLKNYIETGVRLDAQVSQELLVSIFNPKGPLHDGGVILEGDRVAAAACLFPLAQQQRLSRALGTRHRAAIGLTEETDSVVVVVSEETGGISLARDGKITRDLDRVRLKRILENLLLVHKEKHSSKLKKVVIK
ncbi:MAG: diadenylate cyclase CdaA [Candidatus Theseobacter exili]|nr:diadenylate cyclase CdaA [Candidatus Theseobacter exili]